MRATRTMCPRARAETSKDFCARTTRGFLRVGRKRVRAQQHHARARLVDAEHFGRQFGGVLVLFAPIVGLLVAGASNLNVPFQVLLYSVVAFIVIPLVLGSSSRVFLIRMKGHE